MLARCPQFLFGFAFLGGSGDRSLRARSLTCSLRFVAGRVIEFTESCDDDVGDVGVVQLEEPSRSTRDNEWHVVCRMTLNLSAILDEVR